jgi:hypothetical protein
VTARGLVAGTVAASLALAALYVALGGLRYQPLRVADPCQGHPWSAGAGVGGLADQLVRSALDGAACRLGVSRETLALALTSTANRDRFARRYHLVGSRVDDAVRAGMRRAVDDAERAGRLNAIEAIGLRAVVDNVPVDRLLAAVRGLA